MRRSFVLTVAALLAVVSTGVFLLSDGLLSGYFTSASAHADTPGRFAAAPWDGCWIDPE
jgi:hypothetical protein